MKGHDTCLQYTRAMFTGRWYNRRRIRPGTLLLSLFLCLLALAIFFPQWFTHFHADDADFDAILHPPTFHHWFGTDQLGRDVYARVIYGTSLSFTIGLAATLLSVTGGLILALAATLSPEVIRRPLIRVLDILQAFPELLLALLTIAILGRGPANTFLAVGLAGIAGYARLARSQMLLVKQSGYVQHAVTLGEHPAYIVLHHLIPNAIRSLTIMATIGVGQAVLAASSLSFLGLGVAPPTAEWGALLADGRNFLDIAPWISLLPATVIALSVVAITLTGRRLQRWFAKGIE